MSSRRAHPGPATLQVRSTARAMAGMRPSACKEEKGCVALFKTRDEAEAHDKTVRGLSLGETAGGDNSG